MIVKAIERLLFGELYTSETGAKPSKRPGVANIRHAY